ncbi:MAG: DUF3089 domain-containing protein [Aquirufa sp.]
MEKIHSSFKLLFLLFAVCSCSRFVPAVLDKSWKESPIPAEVDYSLLKNWAALPQVKDAADFVPKKSPFKDQQAEAKADVFFIYPTIFTYQPQNEFIWNGSVEDSFLNSSVDSSTILNQATVFNGSCRVFAPRYRQAHYYAFLTPNKEDKEAALDLAYQDVKKAFNYYLTHYNQGRPIIIAGHSQGTVHATRLLKEFFDEKALKKQLVVAYLIGIATPKDIFKDIKPCESSNDIGCFNTWTTFAQGYFPPWHKGDANNLVSTNPLSWTLDEEFKSKELNKGGVSYGFKWVEQMADAQNHSGLLWINKPYVFGRMFISTKNWHSADYNLFYSSIRENVDVRIQQFLSNK